MSWRMTRNDAARATSRSGAATPPWSDAGRSPPQATGEIDGRLTGWMRLDLTTPPAEDAAAITGQRECLLIPLGTEGRPGLGTGAA